MADFPDLANAQEALKGARRDRFADRSGKAQKIAKIAAFLCTGALPVYVRLRTSAAVRNLEALGLPLTVLIDAEGREIGLWFGAPPWE